jgi:hypothetical protein
MNVSMPSRIARKYSNKMASMPTINSLFYNLKE